MTRQEAHPVVPDVVVQAPPSWRPSDAQLRALARMLLGIARRELAAEGKEVAGT
jgi:hypothetical protein